jgi:hypothetical protein
MEAMQDVKKTHTEVKQPQISIPRLADYMAASEQGQRSIAQSCKYRSIARVTQHNEAKAVVSNHILNGATGAGGLKERAEQIRNKIADDDFEEDLNEHNADYIDQFAKVVETVEIPAGAERLAAPKFTPLMLGGMKVSFVPQLVLRRLTKTNKIKSGALMLRYAKNKILVADVANFQSAAIYGYWRTLNAAKDGEAERALCITLDAYTGKCHTAPTNAIYLFNEMKAACATLAERWPAIKPPKNAIL